jgi:hypothetical protein
MSSTSPAYAATTQGTSVYFDTADGTAVSFTDSGAAGTVGFPPDHYRGPEGWLASSRGLKVPGLFTCMAQGSYTTAPAVNVNGILFTNQSIEGGNSNAKTMQMPSLGMQLSDSAGLFQISNTTLTNASFQVSVSATNGGYLIVNDGYNVGARLGPHITNSLSDSSPASGIAYFFNSTSILTDPRKLMSVKNQYTERFAISAYGTTTHTLGNATAKGVVIIAAASQSANLFEIQNSSSTVLNSIDPSGNAYFADGQLSRFSATTIVATGSRNFAQSDNGASVVSTAASAITLTIPTGLAVGFNCSIIQKGSGQVTVGSGTGVSGYAPDGTKSAKQWAIVSVLNTGTVDEYVVGGNVGT